MMSKLLYAPLLFTPLLTLHGCGPDSSRSDLPDPDEESDGGSAPAALRGLGVGGATAVASYPGVGVTKEGKYKISVGLDPNWAPYVMMSTDGLDLAGLGVDFINMMNAQCDDLEIVPVQVQWKECQFDIVGSFDAVHPGEVDSVNDYAPDDPYPYGVGFGLLESKYSACGTYTHAKTWRNRAMDFSHAFTDDQPIGIISRLVDGKPVVSPMSDLTGVKVVDVQNFYPTVDILQTKLIKNSCNSGADFNYDGINWINAGSDGNEAAMGKLKDGSADAMFVYAHQANLCTESDGTVKAGVDGCSNWGGLGTDYAYIHVGMKAGHNGTTMFMSKKGSGLPDLVNPCIQKVLASKAYADFCNDETTNPTYKTTIGGSCFTSDSAGNVNTDFPDAAPKQVFENKQADRTDSLTCSDGYCTCSELPA